MGRFGKGSDWTSWGLIVFGAFAYSVGLNAFLVTNHLAEGGFVGIALLLYYKLHWPLGLTFFILNIPLIIVAWKIFGRSFVAKTFVGVVAVSVFSSLTAAWKVPTHDPLLAALYAGVVMGFGLGVIFRTGATTGGSDIIARLIRHYRGVAMGRSMFLIDLCVISMVALIIGRQTAMYSLVALFVASRVIDFVIEGANSGRALLIVSNNTDAISDAILSRLERGTTLLKARGGFTGQDREVVYCVVAREEVTRVERIVQEMDPYAFVVVYNVHEVLGEGFTFHPPAQTSANGAGSSPEQS